mgnify:CR=1 FL=1
MSVLRDGQASLIGWLPYVLPESDWTVLVQDVVWGTLLGWSSSFLNSSRASL